MSLNKVLLIGHVGKDPEVRHLENDKSVANFSLATTERGYTKKDGQTVPDQTEWHNIVIWGGLVKVVEPHVKKGTHLFIEGKIKTRSYDDKEGNKRYVTDVFAYDLKFLGSKQSSNEENSSSNQPTEDCPF